MCSEGKKLLWLTVLRYSLDCGSLDSNPQDLRVCLCSSHTGPRAKGGLLAPVPAGPWQGCRGQGVSLDSLPHLLSFSAAVGRRKGQGTFSLDGHCSKWPPVLWAWLMVAASSLLLAPSKYNSRVLSRGLSFSWLSPVPSPWSVTCTI